jgi:hypothetical protein
MNFWEKLQKVTPINEIHPSFRTMENDGWCSNNRTLSGTPAFETQIKLDKGELEIFEDVPFFVKIKRNPEKTPGFSAVVYADAQNVANMKEWLFRINIPKDRITEITHLTEKSSSSNPKKEDNRRDETAAA